MNIMELSGAIGGIIGAVTGSLIGFDLYGWIGLIIGLPIGFMGGLIFSVSFISLLFFIRITQEKFYQRWKLKSTFGRYWLKSKKEK